MHIAHSALRNNNKNGQPKLDNDEIQQRIAAYQTACKKYRQEIAAIRKYLPDWMPAFDTAR